MLSNTCIRGPKTRNCAIKKQKPPASVSSPLDWAYLGWSFVGLNHPLPRKCPFRIHIRILRAYHSAKEIRNGRATHAHRFLEGEFLHVQKWIRGPWSHILLSSRSSSTCSAGKKFLLYSILPVTFTECIDRSYHACCVIYSLSRWQNDFVIADKVGGRMWMTLKTTCFLVSFGKGLKNSKPDLLQGFPDTNSVPCRIFRKYVPSSIVPFGKGGINWTEIPWDERCSPRPLTKTFRSRHPHPTPTHQSTPKRRLCCCLVWICISLISPYLSELWLEDWFLNGFWAWSIWCGVNNTPVLETHQCTTLGNKQYLLIKTAQILLRYCRIKLFLEPLKLNWMTDWMSKQTIRFQLFIDQRVLGSCGCYAGLCIWVNWSSLG